MHKFGLNSTQLLQLKSTPSPTPTAPNSSRSGGLEGCSGRASKLPPTNEGSCSLNQRHRYQRPPACSFPTLTMMSCTNSKTCLRRLQTQHHLPTATALTALQLCHAQEICMIHQPEQYKRKTTPIGLPHLVQYPKKQSSSSQDSHIKIMAALKYFKCVLL